MGEYRRTVNAWCLYDWGNSAFATTIMAGVFPLFYRSMATAGLGEADATAAWAYTTSIALLIVAVIGPPLGSLCDQTASKKRFLAFFAGLGVCASALLVLLGDDSYLTGSVLFIAGNIGFASANIFYESLLPHVARPGDIDRVSTRGYAMGYIGGGLLLIFNLLWIMQPGWFLLPDTGFALRLAFFSVALWWAAFTVPLLRRVEEPGRPTAQGSGVGQAVADAFRRLASTFRQVRRYRQLLLFLVAFWLYNDGIGTIARMAVVYGDEVGIGRNDLITALILTQVIGVPCTFGFGRLALVLGTKRAILVGLGVYGLISVGGYFMQTALHFYILAGLVGMVLGGTQALSRSLYASMIPPEKSAEFFGFYSTSSRFAGIFGPLVFGVVGQVTGGSRLGIVALVFFFLAGAALLLLVDEREGRRLRRKNETRCPNPRGSEMPSRGT